MPCGGALTYTSWWNSAAVSTSTRTKSDEVWMPADRPLLFKAQGAIYDSPTVTGVNLGSPFGGPRTLALLLPE